MNFMQRALSLEPLFLMVGRLLIAIIFLHEGISKIMNYAAASDYAEAARVPGALLPVAIITELACGVMILTGFCARIAAFLLSGFFLCVYGTGVSHQFCRWQPAFAFREEPCDGRRLARLDGCRTRKVEVSNNAVRMTVRLGFHFAWFVANWSA